VIAAGCGPMEPGRFSGKRVPLSVAPCTSGAHGAREACAHVRRRANGSGYCPDGFMGCATPIRQSQRPARRRPNDPKGAKAPLLKTLVVGNTCICLSSATFHPRAWAWPRRRCARPWSSRTCPGARFTHRGRSAGSPEATGAMRDDCPLDSGRGNEPDVVDGPAVRSCPAAPWATGFERRPAVIPAAGLEPAKAPAQPPIAARAPMAARNRAVVTTAPSTATAEPSSASARAGCRFGWRFR